MAQLKDTVISGSLRATDSLLTTTLQAQILKVPTSNGGTSYGPGFNGYVLISNGTSTYWGTTTGISQVGTIVTGTWNATEIAVNKGGTGKTSWTPWGIIYASANTTLAQVTAGASGNNGYLLESKGAAAPDWIQATDSNVGSTIVKRNDGGDFDGRVISGIKFKASRSNHDSFTGMVAENTDSTNPLKLGYIIGTGGEGGIYDYTHSAWKVEIAPDGTTNFYGNADTATKAKVTNFSLPSSGNQVNYVILSDSTTTGDQDLKNTSYLYLWENTSTSYLNVGASGTIGAITLYNGTGHVNIIPATLTANTTRTLTIQDASGTVCLTDGTGASGTWGISITGDCSGNAGSATKLSTTGGATKFWRGDNTWSDTISGGTLKITANNNTLTIGSQNTSWCHFTNSATMPFYFNHQIHVVDGFVVYNTNTKLTNNSLAFASGGGWSMSDTTWIRTVGSKSVYMNAGTFRCDGTIQAGSSGNYTWTNGGVLTSLRLIATSATDAVAGSVAAVALITGPSTGTHMEFDGNEIIAKSSASAKSTLYFNENGYVNADGKIYNAVWNDFAEYRSSDITEPGRVVVSDGKGRVILSTERLQVGGHVISDTYGMAVGESDQAKTPLGVAGRVLVIPYQNRNNYHIGDCLCTAPDGTADIMTREEIIKYPDRIIGIVDEIPDYEIWDQSFTTKKRVTHMHTEVNDRIWIYVK